MFELPGLNSNGDVKADVGAIRRYLTRLVPQLEQELANLGTDNFATAYNERIEGLTSVSSAGKSVSTAEAIANHLLDNDNPHKVTAEQLGLGEQLETTQDGALIWRSRGWQAVVMAVEVGAGTDEPVKSGELWVRDVSLGDWPEPFDGLTWWTVQIIGAADGVSFLGRCGGADEEQAGSARVFRTTSADEDMTLLVMGVGTVYAE